MNINLTCCMFVLDNEQNTNVRKNDIKTIKILVNKSDHSLIKFEFDKNFDIKETIRNNISKIISSNKFHLEQVYTMGDSKYYGDKSIDIIYLGITNIKNIKNLNKNYELINLSIENNHLITFGNNSYEFKTREKVSNQNIEYFHDICIDDIILEKQLVEILTAYKHLRTKIDSSDIMFKFMDETFTLEDLRIVYKMIKDVDVDKSNFRKKIVKYCEKVDDIIDNKGHRPTQKYKFKPLINDIWL